MPFALVPFLLLVIPIVEIAAFILIGGQIGIGWTLLMILVTAIIGTFFLRQQGFAILNKIKAETGAGRIPGKSLGEGAMVLVAGILLLTPGFITDAIGFLLFVPFVRSAIWSFAASRITVITPQADMFRQHTQQPSPYEDETVIDLTEDEYSTRPDSEDSPWNKKED